MRAHVLLSFDIEEFDVPLEYGQTLSSEIQLSVSRTGLESVLNLLDRLNVRATFFITAYFAQQHPSLVQRIAQTHEVASHGFYHDRFAVEDLVTSRQVLAKLSAQPIRGFRMARLQPINDRAIAEAGYEYNSSMNPTWLPGRYNNMTQPRLPYRANQLLNIPVSVTPWIRFPLFWLSFKLLPFWLYQGLSWLTLKHDRMINLYFHPWEFTNIRGYGLPSYIVYHCGQPMLDRLEKYILWIKPQGKFITFSEFLEMGLM